jgi:hypothetical protein
MNLISMGDDIQKAHAKHEWYKTACRSSTIRYRKMKDRAKRFSKERSVHECTSVKIPGQDPKKNPSDTTFRKARTIHL